MIVRILGEGQFRLPDSALTRINELDAKVEASLADAEAFPAALSALLDSVRSSGTELSDEELESSDVVLPASGSTAEEVREMLTEEGLIPD